MNVWVDGVMYVPVGTPMGIVEAGERVISKSEIDEQASQLGVKVVTVADCEKEWERQKKQFFGQVKGKSQEARAKRFLLHEFYAKCDYLDWEQFISEGEWTPGAAVEAMFDILGDEGALPVTIVEYSRFIPVGISARNLVGELSMYFGCGVDGSTGQGLAEKMVALTGVRDTLELLASFKDSSLHEVVDSDTSLGWIVYE